MDHAFTPSPLVHGSAAELQAHSLDNHRLGLIQDKSMHGPVAELQRLLGYSLNDPRLLVEALTHPSHPSRPTYERLEHLGDAALNLAFTKYLYSENPTLEPGPLTVLRSANVCNEKLARVAVCHNLYSYLRRNAPNLDDMVEKFTQSVIQEDTATTAAAAFGGTPVKACKVLADIVESIAGAVYIDTDYDLRILWKVMKPLLQPIITPKTFDADVVGCGAVLRKLRRSRRLHQPHRSRPPPTSATSIDFSPPIQPTKRGKMQHLKASHQAVSSGGSNKAKLGRRPALLNSAASLRSCGTKPIRTCRPAPHPALTLRRIGARRRPEPPRLRDARKEERRTRG